MKLLIVIICILLTIGCDYQKPNEILIIESIIKRHFNNVPTSNFLIPIGRENFLFENFPIDYKRNNSIESNDNQSFPDIEIYPSRVAEPPPPSNNKKCPSFGLIFHQLVLNNLIDQNEFNDIVAEIDIKHSRTFKLRNEKYESKSLLEVLADKELKHYQSFAYPILTDEYLILHRNYYAGIGQKLGGGGAGMFFVYKKKSNNWELVYKSNTWIT